MKVALETNPLYTTQAGVARYLAGLIRGFGQLNAPNLSIDELAWPVENFGYQQPRRALRTAYRELVWAKFLAPAQLARSGVELFHATSGQMVAPPHWIRHVTTLYDLAFLRSPDRFRRWQSLAGRRRYRRYRDADRIICISRFTADEATELLRIPSSKLEVVYCGCDFNDEETIPAEVQPVSPIPSEFFLFVGSLEPGKNLALLKQAYLLAEETGHFLPSLLIVGSRWEGTEREGKAPKGWYYLGRQSDNVLVYLYRRAIAFLFPTKYEGFGLPVPEAMALGCPVICSRVASLPEVGGDAALYAEQNPAAYLAAMRRISVDHDLRKSVVQLGREQAARFSWKNCASETLAVYQSVLAGH